MNKTRLSRETLSTVVVILALLIVQGCSSGTSNSKQEAHSRNPNKTETAGITPQCDPNYSGCVPIATDVDCAGGRGDGPAYVKGPVKVIGKDIYRLDEDRDGIGCE